MEKSFDSSVYDIWASRISSEIDPLERKLEFESTKIQQIKSIKKP